MKQEIFTTADGATTIKIPEWNEHYHSKHGAIQEAEHVFIESGLEYLLNKREAYSSISILEIGFGTGLNALLTQKFGEKHPVKIVYTGLEAYPIKKELWSQLNYADLLSIDCHEFEELHQAKWEEFVPITDCFTLRKKKLFFEDFKGDSEYNLIYFDAFGFRVQPELWGRSILKNMFKALKPNGVLVTYSAKGSVRRSLKDIGFEVGKIPGPPGKREMLRAVKPD